MKRTDNEGNCQRQVIDFDVNVDTPQVSSRLEPFGNGESATRGTDLGWDTCHGDWNLTSFQTDGKTGKISPIDSIDNSSKDSCRNAEMVNTTDWEFDPEQDLSDLGKGSTFCIQTSDNRLVLLRVTDGPAKPNLLPRVEIFMLES